MNTYRWSFLSVRYLQLHACTDCATDITLQLAMSTQSADRAADCTEVCPSFISVTVSGLIGLVAAEIWDDVTKVMLCVLCIMCTLRILCTMGILHIACTYIYCTQCTYCIRCAYCTYFIYCAYFPYPTHYIYFSNCTYCNRVYCA